MLPAQQLTSKLREAIAHHRAGRLDRAEAAYRQIAAADPRQVLVFDLWGQLADQQGRFEDAVRCFTNAYRLDEESLTLAVRLAHALISVGRHSDAERVLRRYVDKMPTSAEAWNALGFVLKLEGRIVEALRCHEKAVTLNPKFVAGWLHFGLTLGVIGRSFQALQQYDRALALDPNCAPARYGRAETLHKVYRLDEALAEYDAYLRMEPHNPEARSFRLFALQNSDRLTREQLFAEHCAYGKLVGQGAASLPGYDLDPHKRLRVAILSPDLRTHSCAYFIEPLLRHLDPAEFELCLYHDHFTVDATTARLKKYAAIWRNFVGQPHAAVERTIRADKPDILIDLAGHIGVSIRLPIIAKRLAPVQITYLGYPDTTGVPAMDFRFTDETADPEAEGNDFATEKLVRFSPVAWAYQPPLDAPDVATVPAAVSGVITFGCFNSPTKFTDSLFATWAKLLATVPNSRLLLKARDFDELAIREDMLARMRRCGIPTDRVELLARTPGIADHLAYYARIDIALDTFPYNGTTTTCEALWMGRPVVTLRGDRHAARVGSSLLRAVGRSEWVAGSKDEYVEIAASLARDPAGVAEASCKLRAQMAMSPLLDHPQQSARFGRALRTCWREVVAGEPQPDIHTDALATAAC